MHTILSRKVINNQITFARYPAFTITELAVSLLISGLIVLAAFNVMDGFSSLAAKTTLQNNIHLEKIQFFKAISEDMGKAKTIKHYDDETIFYLPDEQEISYKIEYDGVVRTIGEVSDTISIVITSWHMIYQNKLPTALEMEVTSETTDIELYRILKRYDNEVLMNLTSLKTE
ncbi:MAG: hypothetical protein HC905_18045 [Bacteroidales bacterium]|nr:hypothetical protein [Bacteroidales bacterium]